MHSKTRETLFLTSLMILTGASVKASEATECYELKPVSLYPVARDLSVPQTICVNSIQVRPAPSGSRPDTVFVDFDGTGLDKLMTGSIQSKGSDRSVLVTALNNRKLSGVCSDEAAAYLTVQFKIDASGKRTSNLTFNGYVSYTSDNCHLNGDTEFLEYVHQ